MLDIQSRKKTFVFQENPDQILHQDLQFKRCEEYLEQMTDEHLIEFIMNEAENFRNQQINDVSATTISGADTRFRRGSTNQISGAPPHILNHV